jgi:hypothetical protein
MRGQYIDFISAYCDRWCDRCQFTERCSSFAVEQAVGMCEGDVEAGIELAIGAPPPRTEAEAERRKQRDEEIAAIPEPTGEEMKAFEREEEQRDERINGTSLTSASMRVALLSRRWLKDHAARLAKSASRELVEALEVARWDSTLIAAKVHRAQHGYDDRQRMSLGHRIQNDWNGSAKVALISIVRSIGAWQVIADATGDPDARQVATELQTLQQEVEKQFPAAWKFRRPGFDGVRRQRWW